MCSTCCRPGEDLAKTGTHPSAVSELLKRLQWLFQERRRLMLSGMPKTYIKTAESGNKRLHAFCGTCGTPIYSSAVENPQS
jgi:hypothetical protein